MNSTSVTETKDPYHTNHTTTQLTTLPSYCNAICIFYAVANVIVIILGIAGNGLVIWIAGFKVKKSVVSTWYLSLAVSDFIFCSFLPLSIIQNVKKEWFFGRFMCKFTSFTLWLNMFSSIFLLVIISVDRCAIVLYPVWALNKRTLRKASVVIVLAWIIAAVLSSPSPVFKDLHNQTQKIVCKYNYHTVKNYSADVVSRFVFGFMIPVLIIAMCYAVIIRKLRSNQMVKSKKPLKIMTVLIATFFVCWLPLHILSFTGLFVRIQGSLLDAYVFSVFLSNVNSCLNPFLYAFMGRDFKMQCYALLSKIENAVEEEGLYTNRGTSVSISGDTKLSTSV